MEQPKLTSVRGSSSTSPAGITPRLCKVFGIIKSSIQLEIYNKSVNFKYMDRLKPKSFDVGNYFCIHVITNVSTGQRTSHSFNENQPMHRRRNFLKEKLNENSRK